MKLTTTPAWQALAAHADTLRPQHLRDLFAADSERFARLSRLQPARTPVCLTMCCTARF